MAEQAAPLTDLDRAYCNSFSSRDPLGMTPEVRLFEKERIN